MIKDTLEYTKAYPMRYFEDYEDEDKDDDDFEDE